MKLLISLMCFCVKLITPLAIYGVERENIVPGTTLQLFNDLRALKANPRPQSQLTLYQRLLLSATLPADRLFSITESYRLTFSEALAEFQQYVTNEVQAVSAQTSHDEKPSTLMLLLLTLVFNWNSSQVASETPVGPQDLFLDIWLCTLSSPEGQESDSDRQARIEVQACVRKILHQVDQLCAVNQAQSFNYLLEALNVTVMLQSALQRSPLARFLPNPEFRVKMLQRAANFIKMIEGAWVHSMIQGVPGSASNKEAQEAIWGIVRTEHRHLLCTIEQIFHQVHTLANDSYFPPSST